MSLQLSGIELERDLSIRDLSDPLQGHHGLQILVTNVANALGQRWSCEVLVRRGPRLVGVAENYDALGFSADVVTRDARYTRYAGDQTMLRSHTSAIVPAALADIAAAGADAPGDLLLVCPGICYRRDSIDRWHTATPHQLDLWRISRRRPPLGEADLSEMIDTICEALAPGHAWRAEPRMHPYTELGRQVDIELGGEQIEVAECGLAHPRLLKEAGLGPEWSGLALGMGLDRLYMVTKGIPDIRLLRSEDPRVASQMTSLAPYHAVSSMPAIKRDLSVSVDGDDEVEDLGDRVRSALGAASDSVEEVAVLSSTAAEDLPPAARERLGMLPGQVNLLVRVTLRALDRTLSDGEANELRDQIYEALHRGTRHSWAARAE